MVGQPGIASASAASAVTQRYRDAATIQVHQGQVQRGTAQPQGFASAIPSEPAVVTAIGRTPLALPAPTRPLPEAATQARAVIRTVLPSQALARRGSAAYEAAASIGRAESGPADHEFSAGSLNIDC